MPSRRLVLAAAFAVAALGTAWWLLSDGLSVEERRLVGTWRHRATMIGPDKGSVSNELLVLRPDGQFHMAEPDRPLFPVSDRPGCWFVRGGRFVIDYESSQLRRSLRPILPYLGMGGGGENSGALEWVSDDEIVLVGAGDYRAIWVRVRDE